MQRLVFKALLALALICGTACSHYRMGTGAEHPFETIFIPAVETYAVLPQATAIFTTQLRDAFIRDGRLRVVNTPEEADVILSVKLGAFRRERLTALPSDTGITRKFGLTLDATCTLTQTKGGKALFTDRPLHVERQIFTEDGSGGTGATILSTQQVQAEYQIVPQLAEPLATQARGAVLDTW
jgi:Lipopolysaccharide-assembly